MMLHERFSLTIGFRPHLAHAQHCGLRLASKGLPDSTALGYPDLSLGISIVSHVVIDQLMRPHAFRNNFFRLRHDLRDTAFA